MENEKQLTLTDRLIGIIIALLFALPTVFFIWFAINMEIASLHMFVATRAPWVTSIFSIVIGFLAPDLLINILGRVWQLLSRLVKWF